MIERLKQVRLQKSTLIVFALSRIVYIVFIIHSNLSLISLLVDDWYGRVDFPDDRHLIEQLG